MYIQSPLGKGVIYACKYNSSSSSSYWEEAGPEDVFGVCDATMMNAQTELFELNSEKGRNYYKCDCQHDYYNGEDVYKYCEWTEASDIEIMIAAFRSKRIICNMKLTIGFQWLNR